MAAGRLQVVLTLALLGPAVARADAPHLDWKPSWPRFRPAEYAFTLAAGTLTPVLILAMPSPPSGWKRPLLLDAALQDSLEVHSRGRQRALQLSSDVIQNTVILYPFLIDAGLVSWLVDDRPDVAFQLALIDAEAFLLQMLMVNGTKRVIGRVRPGLESLPGRRLRLPEPVAAAKLRQRSYRRQLHRRRPALPPAP